jgi:peptidyl-prolyl cis-trans isomerase SurA
MKKVYTYLLMFLFGITSAYPQGEVVDEVVAVVGSEIILLSDIENQYLQYRMQGNIKGGSSIRCQIFENLLFQKLLLNQAEIDSIEVTPEQVEDEMDNKLRYYIRQFGSKDKFEEFYKKSVEEFKEELYDITYDQLMVQMMQYEITKDVKVTPSEVKSFFNSIPSDSLPLINSEYEIMQIVKNPPVSDEEKERIKNKLKDLRERIIKGESFSAMAILYSEDPGSAKKGGELGSYGRGELYPEFEAVAFRLKGDEISEIVETEAGYHILQLIDRKGDYVNVRHILLIPKVSNEDLAEAQHILQGIRNKIVGDSISFEEAARKFSDDPNKNNGGYMINPNTGTIKFEADEIDPSVFFVIDKLEVEEVSEPAAMKTDDGKQAYRLIMLKKRTEPHRADMKEDYDRIQNWALEDKQSEIIKEWISRNAAKTYINVNEKYRKCEFQNDWFN